MQGQPILTKVILKGTTIKDDSNTSAYNYVVSWNQTDLSGSDYMKSIYIICPQSINDIITISKEDIIGSELLVYRGETTSTDYVIFRGTIRSYTQQGGVIVFEGIDKLYETTKQTITYTFDKDVDASAGVISEIFKFIIGYKTTLTADATSVQSSGTTNILSKFVCKSEVVYDVLKKLADALGWIFFYNPEDDKVHFEPKGFVNNTSVLQNAVNIVKSPEWKTDSSLLFNKIRIDGASQEALTTETGRIGTTTGYTTSSIQLTQIPMTIRVLCDSSTPPTTERTLGVPESTTPYDYYGDKTKKQVIWNTGTYTPGASDYVIVQYTFNRPTPIVVSDIDSINTYGLKEKTLEKSELTTVADAELYAMSYLTDHKTPIVSTELKITNVLDLDIGQSVRVIDSNNNIDSYFKITEIKRGYPYSFDTIKVTSDILEETDYLVMVDRKLKELERATQDDYSSLIERLDFYDNIIAEDRYATISKGTITSGVLYWDNDVQGNWAADDGSLGFNWGDDNALTLTTQQIEQSDKKYIELFVDNDFKSSTTGTWNTTTNQLELANTQNAISSAFALDINNTSNNAYTSARFEITGTALDKLTYYIGENNNSSITYTTVITSGNTTNRTGTINLVGTNKYGINWKVIASDTVTITKLIITYT